MNNTCHNKKKISSKQIAVYGKGGIGKSTISANLSAAMALAGTRILQVGCDPKQDSTRLLLTGRRITTVLDYLRTTTPNNRNLDDIVHIGFAGVACVEAGGPEPGVGCAGRGILSALDLLESLGIGSHHYDIALYDVLGDVVCGGFAVPLRKQYADIIYIVTSGEFMSLYAANNILRGVRNFEEGGLRMGGIIFNSRDLVEEDECVQRFADAVHLPIVASLPRSPEIGEAERMGQTVLQALPSGPTAGLFTQMAKGMLQFTSPLPAHPLSPQDLESTALKKMCCSRLAESLTVSSKKRTLPDGVAYPPQTRPRRYHSKSVKQHEVLHGCAFNGAAHTLLQIRDALTMCHGPRSCAYISHHGMVAAARRSANRAGIATWSIPCLESSDMDEQVVIFGGNNTLEKNLYNVVGYNPQAVFVVTTCASGIIGDDVNVAIAAVRNAFQKETPVIPIIADGNINGDYMQGIIDAMISVADRYIDPNVTSEPDSVNIVGEKNLAGNTDANYEAIRALLTELGLKINCRFIRNCTTRQLTSFLKGRVNLLASADHCGRTIRNYLINHFNAFFLPSAFPVGFRATELWLNEIAGVFGKEEKAADIIAGRRIHYEEAIGRLRPYLEGKRLFIVTQSYQIDWVFDLAFDLGMEITKVGILTSSWDDEFISRYEGKFPIALSYTRAQRNEEIRSITPDLTLTNAIWQDQPEDLRVDSIPIIPDAGFESGLAVAKRWQRLMQLPAKEGWRYDI